MTAIQNVTRMSAEFIAALNANFLDIDEVLDFAFYAKLSTVATSATNKAVLDAAVTAAAIVGGGKVFLPQGWFACDNLLPPPGNNVQVMGQGLIGGTTLSAAQATGNFMSLWTWASLEVHNIYFTSHVKRTSGACIEIADHAFMPVVENCRIDYHFLGILILSSSTPRIENVTFRYMLGYRNVWALGSTTLNVVTRPLFLNINSDNPYPVNANGPLFTWAAGISAPLGAITVRDFKIYQCSVAGTTGATGPTGIPGIGAGTAFTTAIVDGAARWLFVADHNLIGVTVDSYVYSTFMDKCCCIGGGRSLGVIDTVGGATSMPLWTRIVDFEGDHSYYGSALIMKNFGLDIDLSWFGSSRLGAGIEITAEAGGTLKITNTECSGNYTMGINILAVLSGSISRDIVLDNVDCGMNSQFGIASFPGIYIGPNNKGFQLTKSRCGANRVSAAFGAANRQSYGCMVDNGNSDDYIISLNRWYKNLTGGLFEGTGIGGNKYTAGNITVAGP